MHCLFDNSLGLAVFVLSTAPTILLPTRTSKIFRADDVDAREAFCCLVPPLVCIAASLRKRNRRETGISSSDGQPDMDPCCRVSSFSVLEVVCTALLLGAVRLKMGRLISVLGVCVRYSLHAKEIFVQLHWLLPSYSEEEARGRSRKGNSSGDPLQQEHKKPAR
jgi:hypothetical protein